MLVTMTVILLVMINIWLKNKVKIIYLLYILVLYVFDVVLRLLINSVFPNNTKYNIRRDVLLNIISACSS